LIERLTARITNQITTLTDLEINDYQRLKLSSKEKFVAIPYGLDSKGIKFSQGREETRQRLGFSGNEHVVGWVGRLVPIKDCGTFLHAASLLKELSPGLPSPARTEGKDEG